MPKQSGRRSLKPSRSSQFLIFDLLLQIRHFVVKQSDYNCLSVQSLLISLFGFCAQSMKSVIFRGKLYKYKFYKFMSHSRCKNTPKIQRPRMTTINFTHSRDKNMAKSVLNTGGKLKCLLFSPQHRERNDLFLEQHMLFQFYW